MKTFALLATIVNAILVVSVFEHLHRMELRDVRERCAAEVNSLQNELDHYQAMAAALAQRLSQQEQGEQLEKFGAQ